MAVVNGDGPAVAGPCPASRAIRFLCPLKGAVSSEVSDDGVVRTATFTATTGPVHQN
jgi:hypothetical protein